MREQCSVCQQSPNGTRDGDGGGDVQFPPRQAAAAEAAKSKTSSAPFSFAADATATKRVLCSVFGMIRGIEGGSEALYRDEQSQHD